MAITATRDQLRLELGDTNSTSYIFNDEELDYFLTEESDDVLAACLRACHAAARKFSRAYDFETDGQKYQRSQMQKAFAAQAATLEAQGVTTSSATAVTTIDATKIDGYSQDVDNQEVTHRRTLADNDFDIVP